MKHFTFLFFSAFLLSTAYADEKTTIARDAFNYPAGQLNNAASGTGWKGPWKASSIRPAVIANVKDQPKVLIRGTSERNNPLRRELTEPFRSK